MSEGENAAANKPNLSGKYELETNDKFDEFLNANGANWLIRKMATSSSPTLEVTQDGDKFHIKLASLVHTKETDFTVGTEFEETQQNGAVMKVTPKWEGQKLVMNYEPKDPSGPGKPQTHTRELEGEKFVLTLQVGDVTAKRIFKRVTTA